MALIDQISLLATAIKNKLNTMTPRLLPSGGVTNQVLAKSSNTNYATTWVEPTAGTGGVDESFVITMNITFGGR